jgi:hypothetical protein
VRGQGDPSRCPLDPLLQLPFREDGLLAARLGPLNTDFRCCASNLGSSLSAAAARGGGRSRGGGEPGSGRADDTWPRRYQCPGRGGGRPIIACQEHVSSGSFRESISGTPSPGLPPSDPPPVAEGSRVLAARAGAAQGLALRSWDRVWERAAGARG